MDAKYKHLEPQISRSIIAQRTRSRRARNVECTRHNVLRLGNVQGQSAVVCVTAVGFDSSPTKTRIESINKPQKDKREQGKNLESGKTTLTTVQGN